MKLHYFLLPVWLLFFPNLVNGQFQDNFDDGDFTNNPTWEGDSVDFIVNSDNELQLSGSGPNTSTLYVNTQIPDNTIWELYFNAALAPSGSNGLRIYLQSDDPTFTNGNGYFFEFGESGSDDAINFFRMDNGASTILGTGQLAAVGSAPADGRMRITRTNSGDWEVQVDYDGGNNLTTDLIFTDNTYPGSAGNYFGIQCEYTSSNVDNFFFDDINIAILPDVTPPAIINVEIISDFDLDVLFNEPVDEASAEQISNYIVNSGVGNPVTAILDATNPSLVHLNFSNSFITGQQYTLTISGVQDPSENTLLSQDFPFTFFFVESPQQYEILINEFMYDPNPTIGLPDVEFVELFNNSDKNFDLSGSSISSGGTPQVFDDYIFEPGEYLILTDDANLDSLLPFGNVIAFESFPGLTNTGDEFILTNEDGAIVDAISFNETWYQDTNKDEGGWSIERINPSSPCEFETNWRASEDISGGTPGKVNSVLNQNQSATQAEVINVFLTNFDQLILTFNVAVDQMLATDFNNFTIIPNLDIQFIIATGDLSNQVLISFNTPLEIGQIYSISTTNLTDCVGNPAASNSINFGKPETAEAGDLIINEILFNPDTGSSVDYVELYNHSNKVINLNSLSIGNFLPGDSTANAITTNYLLLPQSYAALTNNRADILEKYTVEAPDALRSTMLPGFDDGFGNVTIFRSDPNGSTIIDQFDYEDDFHSAFLDDDNGVSLERISFDNPTQLSNNWNSAAASAGFGTPTYVNSQFANLGNTEDLLSFTKNVFSPDADGFEDLLFIQFNTGQAGFSADVKIYDAEGRLIKHLVRNELIPTEGTLRWDGVTDELEKAPIGIYILLAEFVSDEGDVRVAKETFVLATRL